MDNMIYSATSLENLRTCGRKTYLANCNLQQFNPNARRAKEETVAVKTILTEYFTENIPFDENKLDLILDDTLYMGDYQKKAVCKKLNSYIRRFLNWDDLSFKKVLEGAGHTTVNFTDDIAITVSYDLIFENLLDGTVEVVKFQRKEPFLSSHGAAKPENQPCNSFELLAMCMAGKELYPDKTVKASFYHLKGKKDTATELMEYFNEKKEWNVISWTFTERNKEDLINVLSSVRGAISFGNCLDVRNDKKCEGCTYEEACKAKVKDTQNFEIVEEETHSVETNITLTPDQLEVAETENGIVRTNAAAGTGKTMVIIHRIVKLLKSGTRPEKILTITFTNKAAEELRQRISKLCLQENLDVDVDKLNIYTFNAFGDKILAEHKDLIGLSNVKIATKVDIFNVIEYICKDVDFSLFYDNEKIDIINPTLQFMNKKGILVFLSEFFNEIKVHNWSTVEDCEAGDTRGEYNILTHEQAELVFSLYLDYVDEMKRRNFIEYQDQINYTYYILDAFPNVCASYKFDHIMVDEYQDTDESQVRLLKILLDNGFKSFMVVGDDAQAIYSFRLADQNNIIKFDEIFSDYGEIGDIRITENFRSTAEILHAANVLNSCNENKIEGKDLQGRRSGIVPKLKYVADDKNDVIVSMINNYHETGVAYGDIAIIARTQKELRQLILPLEQAGIPYKLQIPEKVILHPDIIAIKALAEALTDTDNRYSFLTYLLRTVEDVSELDIFTPNELYQYIDSNFKLIDFPEDLNERLKFFFDLCAEKFGGSEIVDKFLTDLSERDFQNFIEMNDYLSKLFLFNDNQTIAVGEDNINAVKLITAHTSKGKEWKNVIVLLDQFANTTRDKDVLKIDEERRLLFVAITRARDVLDLLISYGAKTYDFISEFGESIETIQ